VTSNATHTARFHASDAQVRDLIEQARRRSPSFDDVIATLNGLDLAVDVEPGACRHRAVHGCLEMVASEEGARLRVAVDLGQPVDDAIAALAHLLYHAAEAARDPTAVDAPSLEHLFARIGEHSCGHPSAQCWETRAALAFEALVARQLAATRTPS
jgi:hypothetical protein